MGNVIGRRTMVLILRAGTSTIFHYLVVVPVLQLRTTTAKKNSSAYSKSIIIKTTIKIKNSTLTSGNTTVNS